MTDLVVMQEAIIKRMLEEHINPMLSTHGGSAKLMEIKDNKAHIEFSGGCQGCAGARMTLGRYIASAIKSVVPALDEIVDVTDHDAGENPFYKPEDLDESN